MKIQYSQTKKMLNGDKKIEITGEYRHQEVDEMTSYIEIKCQIEG